MRGLLSPFWPSLLIPGVIVMIRKSTTSFAAELLLACVLLLSSPIAMAQRHGGGGMGGGIPGASNRPTGVNQKDDLKDFHRALAVQATSQQIAEFQTLLKETDAAKTKLASLVQPLGNTANASRPGVSAAEVDQSVELARTHSQKFVDGLSAVQKSGLKDTLKKLGKADSDLEAEAKKLSETLQPGNPAGTAPDTRGDSLTKSLADFSDQQLALGREMGMTLAQGTDVTFNLPEVKSTVSLGDQTLALPVSGDLSQIATQGAQRTFRLQIAVDLSELQRNTAYLLRSQINQGRACGERLVLREASIAPATPATLVTLRLHYERWSCIQALGQGGQELAEGEGSVQVKLSPAVDKANSLKLTAEFAHIDASGAMEQSLRSGDLGDDLRDRLSQSMLAVMQAGVNFEKVLPAAVRNLAVVQSAKFENSGIGRMAVVFDGQMQISDAQANAMATQLNQALFAQGTASQEPDPTKGR